MLGRVSRESLPWNSYFGSRCTKKGRISLPNTMRNTQGGISSPKPTPYSPGVSTAVGPGVSPTVGPEVVVVEKSF